jgi:hypothetical protein
MGLSLGSFESLENVYGSFETLSGARLRRRVILAFRFR